MNTIVTTKKTYSSNQLAICYITEKLNSKKPNLKAFESIKLDLSETGEITRDSGVSQKSYYQHEKDKVISEYLDCIKEFISSLRNFISHSEHDLEKIDGNIDNLIKGKEILSAHISKEFSQQCCEMLTELKNSLKTCKDKEKQEQTLLLSKEGNPNQALQSFYHYCFSLYLPQNIFQIFYPKEKDFLKNCPGVGGNYFSDKQSQFIQIRTYLNSNPEEFFVPELKENSIVFEPEKKVLNQVKKEFLENKEILTVISEVESALEENKELKPRKVNRFPDFASQFIADYDKTFGVFYLDTEPIIKYIHSKLDPNLKSVKDSQLKEELKKKLRECNKKNDTRSKPFSYKNLLPLKKDIERKKAVLICIGKKLQAKKDKKECTKKIAIAEGLLNQILDLIKNNQPNSNPILLNDLENLYKEVVDKNKLLPLPQKYKQPYINQGNLFIAIPFANNPSQFQHKFKISTFQLRHWANFYLSPKDDPKKEDKIKNFNDKLRKLIDDEKKRNPNNANNPNNMNYAISNANFLTMIQSLLGNQKSEAKKTQSPPETQKEKKSEVDSIILKFKRLKEVLPTNKLPALEEVVKNDFEQKPSVFYQDLINFHHLRHNRLPYAFYYINNWIRLITFITKHNNYENHYKNKPKSGVVVWRELLDYFTKTKAKKSSLIDILERNGLTLDSRQKELLTELFPENKQDPNGGENELWHIQILTDMPDKLEKNKGYLNNLESSNNETKQKIYSKGPVSQQHNMNDIKQSPKQEPKENQDEAIDSESKEIKKRKNKIFNWLNERIVLSKIADYYLKDPVLSSESGNNNDEKSETAGYNTAVLSSESGNNNDKHTITFEPTTTDEDKDKLLVRVEWKGAQGIMESEKFKLSKHECFLYGSSNLFKYGDIFNNLKAYKDFFDTPKNLENKDLLDYYASLGRTKEEGYKADYWFFKASNLILDFEKKVIEFTSFKNPPKNHTPFQTLLTELDNKKSQCCCKNFGKCKKEGCKLNRLSNIRNGIMHLDFKQLVGLQIKASNVISELETAINEVEAEYMQ